MQHNNKTTSTSTSTTPSQQLTLPVNTTICITLLFCSKVFMGHGFLCACAPSRIKSQQPRQQVNRRLASSAETAEQRGSPKQMHTTYSSDGYKWQYASNTGSQSPWASHRIPQAAEIQLQHAAKTHKDAILMQVQCTGRQNLHCLSYLLYSILIWKKWRGMLHKRPTDSRHYRMNIGQHSIAKQPLHLLVLCCLLCVHSKSLLTTHTSCTVLTTISF